MTEQSEFGSPSSKSKPRSKTPAEGCQRRALTIYVVAFCALGFADCSAKKFKRLAGGFVATYTPAPGFEEWIQNDGLVVHMMSFLPAMDLVIKKAVSKHWNVLCTTTNQNKCPNPKAFVDSNKELCNAVKQYCGKFSDNVVEGFEEVVSTYGPCINDWNVGNVTNFNRIFYGIQNFNEDLNKWDVSKAKSMEGMFIGAKKFNKPLNTWDVHNVEVMTNMFTNASAFNQRLDRWDVSKVKNMGGMFLYAVKFNQSLSSWDFGRVQFMNNMFYGATSFNQPLVDWDIDHVENYNHIIGRNELFDQELPLEWDRNVAFNGWIQFRFRL